MTIRCTAGDVKMGRSLAMTTILALTLVLSIQAHVGGERHDDRDSESRRSEVQYEHGEHDHQENEQSDHPGHHRDHGQHEQDDHQRGKSIGGHQHGHGKLDENEKSSRPGHHHEHGQHEERIPHSHSPHGLVHDHEHVHDGKHWSAGADDSKHASVWTKGLWFRAMGSSLLLSLASLICLSLLPLIAVHGKLSKVVVDALASFGAGSMLGDAVLHQLPHAFGDAGGHDHGHAGHGHDFEGNGGEHAHAHTLESLSVGLSVLGGILLFFLLEKVVRHTEEYSLGGHRHHHHHPNAKKGEEKFTEDDEQHGKDGVFLIERTEPQISNVGTRKRKAAKGEELEEKLKERKTDGRETDFSEKTGQRKEASRLVLGYLNLISDGVHNFTDGMALGSAFLLHGAVGGWSRFLFLLAHELPQEVGDFGILLSSGFGVYQALAFNFLSALLALAGTALSLLLGTNSGNSALIEGFTAGGFIYIAVGIVLPDMHSLGNSFRSTMSQLTALSLGVGVSIVICLAE